MIRWVMFWLVFLTFPPFGSAVALLVMMPKLGRQKREPGRVVDWSKATAYKVGMRELV